MFAFSCRTHDKNESSIYQKVVPKISMAYHVQAHSSEIFFNCDVHINKAHLLRKLMNDSKSRDEFCNFELLDKLQLKHGCSETMSEKNFKCDRCKKSYATQSTLNQHKKQVNSMTTFVCKIC